MSVDGLTRTLTLVPVRPMAGVTISHGAGGDTEVVNVKALPDPPRFTCMVCGAGNTVVPIVYTKLTLVGASVREGSVCACNGAAARRKQNGVSQDITPFLSASGTKVSIALLLAAVLALALGGVLGLAPALSYFFVHVCFAKSKS